MPRAFRPRPIENGRDERTTLYGATLESLKAQPLRPLVVEIGCGVGLHPIQYAELNPSKNIVAIERTSEKFQRFLGRLESHPHLKNQICAVHGDAIHFLDQNFETSSIDEVWLLYPNPEPKKPSRRWFQAPFMKRLVELMKPNARLVLATNIKSYADESLEFASSCGLINTASRVIRQDSQFAPRTHFEKKYFERGESLYDFEFRRRGSED